MPEIEFLRIESTEGYHNVYYTVLSNGKDIGTIDHAAFTEDRSYFFWPHNIHKMSRETLKIILDKLDIVNGYAVDPDNFEVVQPAIRKLDLDD